MPSFNINSNPIDLSLISGLGELSTVNSINYIPMNVDGQSTDISLYSGFEITTSNPQYELMPIRNANSTIHIDIQGNTLQLIGVSLYKYRPVFIAPGATSLIKLAPLPTLQIEYPRSGQIFPLGDGTESIEIRTQVG